MDDLKEFEDQLNQEAIAKAIQNNEVDESRIRKDDDGTVYEFDPIKRAWFPKIDDDFIARYQMNYGSNECTSSEPTTATRSQPPSDIYSEEYRVWYEQYCENYARCQDAVQHTTALPERDKFNAANDFEDDDAPPPSLPNNKSGKAKKRHPKTSTAAPVGEIKKPDPVWFEMEDSRNTAVYVSGLPLDVTEEEFKEVMNKVGIVAFDPILKAPKLKLYRNPDGSLKGDGRCCYMKSESVDLALNILDGYDFKGHKISVEKAIFTQKGTYDPSRKRRKLTKQEKKKFNEKQEKLLGWLPPKNTDSRPKFERTCVIKNVFLPTEFDEDPSLYDEITSDMKEECSKYGEVKKVMVYDRNEEGIVTVTFKTPEEADNCKLALHGRWFAKRQLVASNWDGKTKYLVSETEQEMDERLKKWHAYLDDGDRRQSDSKTEVKKSELK